MSVSAEKLADAAPATARLFFALWPTAEVVAALNPAAIQHAEALGGKATRPETLHLTLLFLGNFRVDRIPYLIEAARTVRFSRFSLRLDCLGAWSHNRLLWAGCQQTPPALHALVADLQRALVVGGLFVASAPRDFVPHLTLVRKLARLPAADELRAIWPPLAWPVSEFVLLQSPRDSHSSRYVTLAKFPAHNDEGMT
ncbi:RNA 2',3'-cyclic phosphodiesterase [Dechloromonas sp.]|uniref:RNA 2',3'-cyclic phosphodiesterase n=1 Tax=Dechloromonas sp. TaxID=1917218 RepID=UPI00263F7A53|nr:RNA 2',3'-cyclic phosphodiesterase [Dechloromonas sp.]